MKHKDRLDKLVLARGLAATREKAQALIIAGRIEVERERGYKPGDLVPLDAEILLLPGEREFASRGGGKLSPVLEHWQLDLMDKAVLDLGASTGGFTDVVLRRGARRVTAVDVGKGLIDVGLRRDPRVTLLEQTNARYLRAEQLELPFDLLLADLSFISLSLVLPSVLPFVADDGCAVLLVKPQFELSRAEVGRGGVVRDDRLRLKATERIASCLAQAGWIAIDVIPSPLPGPKGNRELFLWGARPGRAEPRDWRKMWSEEPAP